MAARKITKSPFSDKLFDILDGKYEDKGIPKMTDAELGRKAGLTRQQINDYKNGKSKATIDNLLALTKALNCSADFLVNDAVTEPRLESATLLSEVGLSDKAINKLKELKDNKYPDYGIIMEALEMLIYYLNTGYADILNPIAKLLLYNEQNKVHLVNETMLEEFEEVLDNSKSKKEIKEHFNTLIYGNESRNATALSEINKDDLYIQVIINNLIKVKSIIYSAHAEDRDSSPVVIPWKRVDADEVDKNIKNALDILKS